MLRVFPIRSCTPGVYRRSERAGRPCLLGFFAKFAAPCVGDISVDDHRELAGQFADFMAGNTATYTRRIEQQMREAAAAMDYETAAGLRDDLQALTKVMEKNSVVLSDATDADLIGLAQDELEASVQVFHVRGGRIRGQRGWTAEILDASGPGELIERALTTLYTEGAAPKEILVPVHPSSREQVLELIGRPVDLRIPQRGEKKDLLAAVTENAQAAPRVQRLKRTGDLSARAKALDDTASMYDVITRRLKHHLDPPEPADEEQPGFKRFAYPPSLILVDGGAPQVAAAQRAFDDLGITDIALAGIAKRLEEIWLPGDDYPVILPRTSEALFLVQRLRDEAHRFALSYHRSKRGRAMQASALDGIAGLGPARRRALLDRFVTVSAIREASEEELQEVQGIGPALAAQITAALRSEQATESATPDGLDVTVDMATGEILED